MSEAAMREVIGDRTVDEVITIGRQDIEIAALTRLQELAKRSPARHSRRSGAAEERQSAEPGAGIVQRGEQGTAGPRERDQRRQRRIQQGGAEGQGEAAQTIRGAEGYRFKRVNEAEGDVAASARCFANT